MNTRKQLIMNRNDICLVNSAVGIYNEKSIIHELSLQILNILINIDNFKFKCSYVIKILQVRNYWLFLRIDDDNWILI